MSEYNRKGFVSTVPRPRPRCSQCHTRVVLEDLQPGARLFDPVASTLLDHLLTIETMLAELRRLVEEVVL